MKTKNVQKKQPILKTPNSFNLFFRRDSNKPDLPEVPGNKYKKMLKSLLPTPVHQTDTFDDEDVSNVQESTIPVYTGEWLKLDVILIF